MDMMLASKHHIQLLIETRWESGILEKEETQEKISI